MKVAIVGSRQYPHLEQVEMFVEKLVGRYGPRGFKVVSGGADGVDAAAEQAAIKAGVAVISYRPKQLSKDSWTVTRFIFDGQRSGALDAPPPWPTWADQRSALYFRNILIAEEADRMVAYHDGRSHGTWFARDCAGWSAIPLHVFSP